MQRIAFLDLGFVKIEADDLVPGVDSLLTWLEEQRLSNSARPRIPRAIYREDWGNRLYPCWLSESDASMGPSYGTNTHLATELVEPVSEQIPASQPS